MKQYTISESDEIAYPVGRDMTQTIRIVSQMVEQLKKIYKPETPIQFVVRGSSGAIISGIASTMMKEYDLKIVHFKKEGESSHSKGASIELDRKIIIIDDLISTGTTVNIIYEKILTYDADLEVDTLCVSGAIFTNRLSFKPNNAIANQIYID